MNLFITAITPGIAIALIFYLTDRFDREPVYLLLAVFAGGALAIIPTIVIERFLSEFNIFNGLLRAAYTAFIVAGFSEELMKRLVVTQLAYRKPAFNEKLDGIVYSVFAALGFATVENVMYVVFRFADVESVGFYRAIISVPAHMLFAVTMGYYLSLAKFATDEKTSKYYYRKSLTSPLILHGIFDFILMSKVPFLMFLFIPFVIYLWKVNLTKLNKFYKESKERFE